MLVLTQLLKSEMSAPPPKPSTAPPADNEVELQAQPIDLAHKSSSSSSTASSFQSVPARVIGDASKPIFLVLALPLQNLKQPANHFGISFFVPGKTIWKPRACYSRSKHYPAFTASWPGRCCSCSIKPSTCRSDGPHTNYSG